MNFIHDVLGNNNQIYTKLCHIYIGYLTRN